MAEAAGWTHVFPNGGMVMTGPWKCSSTIRASARRCGSRRPTRRGVGRAAEAGGDEFQPSAIGARVRLAAGGDESDKVRSGSGYISENHRRLHFDVGQTAKIDQVEISWPGGRKQVLRGLETRCTSSRNRPASERRETPPYALDGNLPHEHSAQVGPFSYLFATPPVSKT